MRQEALRSPWNGAAADPRTAPEVETETRASPETDRPWKVIVWNDPVNLMNYVVYVFQKLFGFPHAVATRKMLEVHEQGRSIVAVVDREMAEFYVSRLHSYGLQATMEQDES